MPNVVEKHIHNFFLKKNEAVVDISADDRLKWLPFAIVFLLNAVGLETRSSWKKQVLTAGATEAIRYLLSDNLKKLVGEHRPFPYIGHHSFPSGHTASSFAGAEVMHQELKNSLRLLSCTGYAAATAVAVIRVVKSRHWVRDVVAGAAIGILSAKLAYCLFNRRAKMNTRAKLYNAGSDERPKVCKQENVDISKLP
jgi:membrane-associated phospholipid phosphatase